MKNLILILALVFFACGQNEPPDVVQPSVKIGTQTWTSSNLNVSIFRNGDPIKEAKDDGDWKDAVNKGIPAFCYSYYTADSFATDYGKIYNWYAVIDKRGLAPKGWHIPTDKEWDTLITYLGGESIAGNKLKKAGHDSKWGYAYWERDSAGVTNSSGFGGLPGGYRDWDRMQTSSDINHGESFSDVGGFGGWWSFIDPKNYNLNPARICFVISDNSRARIITASKRSGYSVRCVKD